jgi:ketosteroid isomerase-like protein
MSVGAVADNFCTGWASADSKAFSMLFASDGYYIDIAFGIKRRGRDLIQAHHNFWHTALPGFLMVKEDAYESGLIVTVKTICYGTFSGGDLGGGKLRATGKSFRARAISVLELNDQLQIKACTEYYDRLTMPMGEPTLFDSLPWPDRN